MSIHSLPHELLSSILALAAASNRLSGATFSYGLTRVARTPVESDVKPTRYVRGPLSPESLRWDATLAIRQVCRTWHEWALSYTLERVCERRWRGSERWAELSASRRNYSIYELIEKPSGCAVYRDPFRGVRATATLFRNLPNITRHVRHLWFNGLYAAETDALILSIVAQCEQLQSLSVPWTVLRRSTAEDWIDLLNVDTGHGSPLESLEFTAVSLARVQAAALLDACEQRINPLEDDRVSFRALKRLKFFGNTVHAPINDGDVHLIARSATGLRVLDITNLSTISVAGMMALIQASRKTLQVLEHSPRSDDGFFHPFPGSLDSIEADPESPGTRGVAHICTLLPALPSLRDISVSVPAVCAGIFCDAETIQWEGECQVRAADLCPCTGPPGQASTSPSVRSAQLQALLTAARQLMSARARVHCSLSIELFFAGCIFEPGKMQVHGAFGGGRSGESDDAEHHEAFTPDWNPHFGHTEVSTKGPYGTTGIYGKHEGNWTAVSEDAFLSAVASGWILI